VGFWDFLLGRSRVPAARTEPLFALSTARFTLETASGWVPAGRAGLVLRPAEDSAFSSAAREIRDLMGLASQELGGRVQLERDEYGYLWFVFQDQDWEDLVAMTHMAGQTLVEEGYGDRLLAAVFRLEKREGAAAPLYLIFNYKRGSFYPFIPLDPLRKERDTAGEMRVFALLETELPLEKDLSRWYPLWNIPV